MNLNSALYIYIYIYIYIDRYIYNFYLLVSIRCLDLCLREAKSERFYFKEHNVINRVISHKSVKCNLLR